MLEVFFVAYLLILFIFPLPALCGGAVAVIFFFIHKKYILIKLQPANGKQVVLLSAAASAVNFSASLLLSFALASLVSFFIYDFTYLFIFNAAF
ncbi:MAG: hypothetical protein ACE5GQ_00910, partial [Nitrospinales bacterium]